MFKSQKRSGLAFVPLQHNWLASVARDGMWKIDEPYHASFVNTLCNIELGEWGELKVIFQFSLAKLISSNIFGQDSGQNTLELY